VDDQDQHDAKNQAELGEEQADGTSLCFPAWRRRRRGLTSGGADLGDETNGGRDTKGRDGRRAGNGGEKKTKRYVV
jgi:hypothetical protein